VTSTGVALMISCTYSCVIDWTSPPSTHIYLQLLDSTYIGQHGVGHMARRTVVYWIACHGNNGRTEWRCLHERLANRRTQIVTDCTALECLGRLMIAPFVDFEIWKAMPAEWMWDTLSGKCVCMLD
jgi:hypothetical protein